MKRVGSVQFRVRVPACVKSEDGWFISSCPLLDVYSQGKNQEEALRNLAEAIHLFFTSCYERGTLDEVLKASGFSPGEENELASVGDGQMIDISLPLLARKHAEARAC